MTPDDLAAIGRSAFPEVGEEWQSPLAREVYVNARTMRRYADGSVPLSGPIVRALEAVRDHGPKTAAVKRRRKVELTPGKLRAAD